MTLPRSPLVRLLIILWCVMGSYTFTADSLFFAQHFTEDIMTLTENQSSMDEGIKTGTAEIRLPHISANACVLRNPLRYEKQATLPCKCTVKPRRLSHFEYCSRDMVRSIMLQFHPREEYNNNFYGILCHFTAFYVI